MNIEVFKAQEKFNDHLFNYGSIWTLKKLQWPQRIIKVSRKQVNNVYTIVLGPIQH
jgi:hypothetical protein